MNHVPEEIYNALAQPYGFILLIKGKAGTGKTTLALEILTSIENPLYISTRITPKLLYTQFPWIKESLPKENIIDATSFDFKTPLSFTDEMFLKSMKLQQLPDFVKILFSKMDSTSGTVVIDSWDAIAILGATKWGKSHGLMANYIIDLVREKKYNLILIEETNKESYLDYLVDGVVNLSEEIFNDRLIRQLHPTKLRGVRINQLSYLFTLYNGRFRSFVPSPKISFEHLKPPPLIKDKNSKVSTGVADLDALLEGGYPKGSVILFEMDPTLSSDLALFSIGISFNFLLQNRGLVTLTAPGREIFYELAILQNFLGDENIIPKNFRSIEFGKEKEGLPPYIVRTLPKSNIDLFYKIRDVVGELYTKIKEKQIMIVFSLEAVTFTFPLEDIKRDFLQIRSQIKKAKNILYIVGKIGDKIISEFQRVVDLHFILLRINHQLIFYGKNPQTNIYAVVFDTSEGCFHVKLIPII
jgi:KaiC/GvpD/RAD55 family RecA-like ATPase